MNVLLILGHPRTESLCGALAQAYRDGAAAIETDGGTDAGTIAGTGSEANTNTNTNATVTVRQLDVAELEFDPDVHTEDPGDQALEDDLQEAQRTIEWADHLVFVYPNWWGTMPARLKGFFDRVFTSDFAFSFYDEGEGAGHEELLDDKTAELIVTMDMPPWVYRLIYRQPGTNAIKRATLGFAGIRTTRVTTFGPVDDSTPAQRDAWLEKATRLGRSLESGPESTATRAKRKLTTWLKALRLQFYPMAWIAYTIGALAAAGSSDVFASSSYWLGLGFLLFLEAATVLSNEFADYETDRKNTFAGPFTGGSRVLVDDALSFRELRAGIGVALALAGGFGLATVATGAGSTVALASSMVALAVLALGYTLPPLKLSYRTLGELTVAWTHSVGVLLIGFVAVGGSWRAPTPWLLGLPFLLSVLPSITLAGVPDVDADRQADKETVAVRFGIDGAATMAAATALLAALIGVLWNLLAVVPGYSPVIYLGVVHALGLVWLLGHRLEFRAGAQRIDVLMLASLSYIGWFGVVPLVGLL